MNKQDNVCVLGGNQTQDPRLEFDGLAILLGTRGAAAPTQRVVQRRVLYQDAAARRKCYINKSFQYFHLSRSPFLTYSFLSLSLSLSLSPRSLEKLFRFRSLLSFSLSLFTLDAVIDG